MAEQLLVRLFEADDVLLDLPSLGHRVLSRLDAGKLGGRVERHLGDRGVAELARLLFASGLVLAGLLGLGAAVALRNAGGGELLGHALWPTASALLGALGLGVGLLSLWRAGRA